MGTCTEEHNYIKCPNCGKGTGQYITGGTRTDIEYINVDCGNCGFNIYPTVWYRNLDEINSIREENDLPPLTKLPKQKIKTVGDCF